MGPGHDYVIKKHHERTRFFHVIALQEELRVYLDDFDIGIHHGCLEAYGPFN